MATQKNKTEAPEPEATEEAAAGLICRKNSIRVGNTTYRYGNVVAPDVVAALPERLHRWFEAPKTE